jgi:beta-lactamase regulating signal transducer with metallopeptidase domain/predicted metallopeptidase
MIQALGWTLVHFLWQGALLAVLFAVANRILRQATANARYLVGCVTLALMLAAPVATFFRLSQPSAAVQTSFAVAPAAQTFVAVAAPAASPVPPSGKIPWLPLLVAAWAAGVAILSVRMAGGLLVARRLRLRATPVTNRDWREHVERLAARLQLRRGVALCESVLAEVPMAIGWLRPVILVPSGALLRLSPEQMEAILAHELAHVRRLDYAVNMIQAAVETLLFYHPAVWWVGRKIRAERENCCDDLAVALCGDAVVYARALVELETMAGHAPQMAVAATGGSLLSRVKRLLHAEGGTRRNPATGLAAVLVVVTLATAWFCAQPMLHAANSPNGTGIGVRTSSEPNTRESAALQATATTPQTRSSAPTTAQKPSTTSVQKSGDSYIEEMAAAGYPNLSADDLIALKMQGVTPEYARQIRAAGFAVPARKLIAMRTMDVTPEYAKQMKTVFPEITANELIACRTQGVDSQTVGQLNGMGFGKLNVHEVIAARVQGVTADYVRELKSAGFTDLTMNQVIGAKVQGVAPEYVRQLKSEGFTNLTVNEVIGARVQGVTPEYVRELKSQGFTNLSMNQVIGARVQGVTPESVRGLKAAGFTNMTMNEVIGAQVQGVTPEFARGLKAAFPSLTLNQAIAARVQGLTPEYVASLKSLGFPNLTFEEALRAKVMGLTPDFVRQARQHGFQNLTINKLIELKNMGVLSPQ